MLLLLLLRLEQLLRWLSARLWKQPLSVALPAALPAQGGAAEISAANLRRWQQQRPACCRWAEKRLELRRQHAPTWLLTAGRQPDSRLQPSGLGHHLTCHPQQKETSGRSSRCTPDARPARTGWGSAAGSPRLCGPSGSFPHRPGRRPWMPQVDVPLGACPTRSLACPLTCMPALRPISAPPPTCLARRCSPPACPVHPAAAAGAAGWHVGSRWCPAPCDSCTCFGSP